MFLRQILNSVLLNISFKVFQCLASSIKQLQYLEAGQFNIYFCSTD